MKEMSKKVPETAPFCGRNLFFQTQDPPRPPQIQCWGPVRLTSLLVAGVHVIQHSKSMPLLWSGPARRPVRTSMSAQAGDILLANFCPGKCLSLLLTDESSQVKQMRLLVQAVSPCTPKFNVAKHPCSGVLDFRLPARQYFASGKPHRAQH